MKLDELRTKFIEYFKKNGHRAVKSSSLVPENDPTLLFTNAGMNQFKDVFLGAEKRDYKRATSSQKCFRASGKHNDLENVGFTARHHTFFEMLGNFSFGDYFKKDAIAFAWELLTKDLGLDKSRLWVTVYKDDDEAFDLWQKTAAVPADKIVRLGEKDNFWSMGDTGPCGPCSEIVFDQGDNVGCKTPNCKVGCDCDRYLELWNLVFMQYDRDQTGKMTPLPRPSIDTGMGLERITAVMQGVLSNYETDHFRSIIAAIEALGKTQYHEDQRKDNSMRVIADHSRSTAFLIADGILPGNEGRGYVLRRVMRRAARHTRLIGFDEPVLFKVCERVIELMAPAFPELNERRTFILEVVRNEEERFLQTLDNGLRLIREEIDRHQKNKKSWTLPGDVAFKLYDTYGFPLDLTQAIGRDEGFDVDNQGFESAMEKQKERSRANWIGSGAEEIGSVYKEIKNRGIKNSFIGYDNLECGTSSVFLMDPQGNSINEVSGEGTQFQIITGQTCFYGEVGGQVGDRGKITAPGFEAEIIDAKKPLEDLIVLYGQVKKGKLNKGDKLTETVDEELRLDTARNHSATHLLQASLRKILGEHVQQKGSLVDPDRLRFDFTHFSPLSEDELSQVERMVNEMVRANREITIQETSYQNALKSGAMALFGEKYGDTVRMVVMDKFSRELCGGTHCRRTGDIGFFKVVSEASVASGVRRIEALTGRAAVESVQNQKKSIRESAALFKASPTELGERISKLIEENKKLRQDLRQARVGASGPDLEQILAQKKEVNSVRVLAAEIEAPDQNALLDFSDRLMQKLGAGVSVLGSKDHEKAYLVVRVSKDLSQRFNAGKLASQLSEILGGKGGGKPDLARGGGSKPEKLGEALEKTYRLVEEQN